MELRHIRSFVAISDVGGFSSAARRLHLTQPALSRQIGALEHELGVRLFARVGRTVELTEHGADLLRRARAIVGEVDSLGERARALVRGDFGILRVGSTPQTLESVLAPFLGGYQRRHPGVEVHLIEDGAPRLLGHLERGHVQLAVTAVGDERFASRLLFPGHILALMRISHRLVRRRTVDVTDLADDGLLLLKTDFGTRRWFDAACQVVHFRPRILLESSSPATLIALARSGYGIAVVPSNVGFPRGGLHVAPMLQHGVPLGGWMAVSWNRRRFLPAYGDAFIEELARHTRGAYPGRDVTRRLPPPPMSQPIRPELQ
jgi:DNA-binding transcriptional LysR family regulator